MVRFPAASLALVCMTGAFAFGDDVVPAAKPDASKPDDAAPVPKRASSPPPPVTSEATLQVKNQKSDSLGWTYLYDGGALPFFWGSIVAGASIHIFASPPATPRLFSPTAGGAVQHGDTVPESAVALYAIVGAGVIGGIPVTRMVRPYHLKGYVESIMTTAALTEAAKVTFGRHRPYWTPALTSDDDTRRSFFSGHSSLTFATSTYLGLYLHGHVFASWRDPGQAFAWWEVLPLGVLAAGSAAVAVSRVEDNRHNPSDVITGAVVGTALSSVFYAWQEARYRHAESGLSRVQLTASASSIGVAGSW